MVPPVLYLPTREDDSGQARAVLLPMQPTGRALLAYTALDRLAEGCGAGQPWSLVFTSTLDELREQEPFNAIAFDVKFPDGIPAEAR